MEPTAGRILVVDDDPGIRANTVELLELSGHRCVACADGAAAIAWCLEHPGEARLALLDLSMPDMSGTQVLRRLRELDADLPAIIASGSAEEVMLQGLAGRGVAVLRKPARADALLAAVAHALAAR